MDIVHHTAIGGIGFSVLAYSGHELAGASFLAASVLPDLDVFLMVFGKRFYLKNHQGPTHAFLFSPLLAFLVSLPLFYLFDFSPVIFFAALGGLWLHSVLDLFNTFGIAVFWPVVSKRYSLNAVFFIDVTAWLMTGSACAALFFWQYKIVGFVYFILLFFYFFIKKILHIHVINKLKCREAIPSSLNPFVFYILEVNNNSAKTYLYNALNKKISDRQTFDLPLERHLKMAEKSVVFNEMHSIAKFLMITNVVEVSDETTIIAQDLAVRNFGGKFCRTTLTFNKEGNLLDEVAYI